MMKGKIVICKAKKGDETLISNMVKKIFNNFIAPYYSEQGIDTFFKYASSAALLTRLKSNNHFILLAKVEEEIVGVIEVRDNNHIALLFVLEEYHRNGIAKKLYNEAVKLCKNNDGETQLITVNASPYAVKVYEKLGFVKTQDEQEQDGIKFTPMTVRI